MKVACRSEARSIPVKTKWKQQAEPLATCHAITHTLMHSEAAKSLGARNAFTGSRVTDVNETGVNHCSLHSTSAYF